MCHGASRLDAVASGVSELPLNSAEMARLQALNQGRGVC
jgi:hypothetical protein